MKIKNLVSKNIRNLEAYLPARAKFFSGGYSLLDANENNFVNAYNRYPDAENSKLLLELSKLKQIPANNIILGNGSGELIDMVYKCFCLPFKDEVISITPTFGMYKICAEIHYLKFKEVLLSEKFELQKNEIFKAINRRTKLIVLCSPNNPTGNSFNKNDIIDIVRSFKGIVLIDEAYIDFVPEKSIMPLIKDFSRLIVLQTFSKAWGMAGLRLGAAYASCEIISLLKKVKLPYNINAATQEFALQAIKYPAKIQEIAKRINEERKQLAFFLEQLSFVKKVFPSDANFLLIEVNKAKKVFEYLRSKKIIVRQIEMANRSNCFLRISIGNIEDNMLLISALKNYKDE